MSLFELPCLLSSLLLGQTEPGPPAPESEALASRLKVEGGADVYHGYDFNRPADGGLLSGTAQRLVEGTLTLEVKPAVHLVLKLEARHDRSTVDVFAGSDTTAEGTPVLRPTQTLVVGGATAYF